MINFTQTMITIKKPIKHDADALLSNTAGQSANQIAKKCNHEGH